MIRFLAKLVAVLVLVAIALLALVLTWGATFPNRGVARSPIFAAGAFIVALSCLYGAARLWLSRPSPASGPAPITDEMLEQLDFDRWLMAKGLDRSGLRGDELEDLRQRHAAEFLR
jgi:hypothetical protein